MKTPTTDLTVVGLHVDNYKRLTAADLKPSPQGLVAVRGKNAQGKSSLIGSMLDALGATKASADALPITVGERTATVVLDLGEIVVRKHWTRDRDTHKAKPSLSIVAKDGGKIRSPAAVLKELRGHFADPVAFLDLKAPEQVKVVLATLGLDEHLERLEAQAEVNAKKMKIDFGSQIRSYVMQPYQQVKDLRTGETAGDVTRVLGGELTGFMEAWLAARAEGTLQSG